MRVPKWGSTVCEAVMVYRSTKDDRTDFIRCSDTTEHLCYYHAKVLANHIKPDVDDRDYYRLIRVEVKGTPIWTL